MNILTFCRLRVYYAPYSVLQDLSLCSTAMKAFFFCIMAYVEKNMYFLAPKASAQVRKHSRIAAEPR